MLKGICGDGIMSPAQLLSEKERQLRTLPRFFQEKLGSSVVSFYPFLFGFPY